MTGVWCESPSKKEARHTSELGGKGSDGYRKAKLAEIMWEGQRERGRGIGVCTEIDNQQTFIEPFLWIKCALSPQMDAGIFTNTN